MRRVQSRGSENEGRWKEDKKNESREEQKIVAGHI